MTQNFTEDFDWLITETCKMKSTRHSSAVKDKAEKLNSVMGQMRRGSIQTPSISLNHRRSSALEKEGSMISVQSPMSTQVGLRYENIVPCFISNHVKDLCEETCWENWLAANSEAKDAEEDTIDVDSLFKSKVEHSIKDMKPNAEESFAAVVMADVSGYSNLSSTLAEKGAEGAEILSKTMKGYLDKIIDIIIRHGGDIVKFAGIFKFTKGDAVIFYWKLSKDDFNSDKTDDNVRGEIVLQAAHCCLELLKLLGSYEVQIPELGSKILRIHLGIGAGSVYDVNVGGLDRWEHFIGGDAVNQLASVLDLAKAGIFKY